MSKEITVTCVYCGHEFPVGTATHGEKILTDHIKQCPKHPMRKIWQSGLTLRNALLTLTGAEDNKEELEQMEIGIRAAPASAKDKAAIIDAIHALQDTRGIFVTPEAESEGEK